MEAEGDPDEFNAAMTPAKKAAMAAELSKSAGTVMDPDDMEIRAVPSTSPIGYAPLLISGQFTSASAEIKYMTILIIIKGKPGTQDSVNAFKEAASALPVADLSDLVGAKVTSSPKASALPMDEEFERVSKERAENAEEALKKAEAEVKEIFKKGDEKNKVENKAKEKAVKEGEKAEKKQREEKSKEVAKKVKEEVAVADKMQKEVTKKKKEETRKDDNPNAGETWSDGPPLVNSEPIKEGEPCKILLQNDVEGPCWEQRGFTSKVPCAEGLQCGPDRDLGAISYYKENGAVSTEISGSVVYCSVAGKAKLITP